MITDGTGILPTLDAATLQVRKALEAIAIAAIAPDKKAYTALRASASKDPDFTKDYHAAKIFAALGRVNPDFYPKALQPAVRRPDGTWHYDDKKTGVLSKKQFERSYDRLGKHLDAHNPWGTSKNTKTWPPIFRGIIASAKELIALHARFIRTPEFHGVWVVQAVLVAAKCTYRDSSWSLCSTRRLTLRCSRPATAGFASLRRRLSSNVRHEKSNATPSVNIRACSC